MKMGEKFIVLHIARTRRTIKEPLCGEIFDVYHGLTATVREYRRDPARFEEPDKVVWEQRYHYCRKCIDAAKKVV